MDANDDQNETKSGDSCPGDSVASCQSNEEENETIYQRDWDNVERPTDPDKKIVVNDFFLIMEINRFVPYLVDNNIKFHPVNMPFIQIGKMTVVGYVMEVNELHDHIEILVEDGTGALTVLFDLQQYVEDQKTRQEILDRYQKHATNINDINFDLNQTPLSFPEIRPDLKYPEDTPIQKIAILESEWSLETNNGLLGKEIVKNDYIRAEGYCHLDFQEEGSPKLSEEIEFDSLCNAEPVLMATTVECIEEAGYNRDIKLWMRNCAKRRYKISEASSLEKIFRSSFIIN